MAWWHKAKVGDKIVCIDDEWDGFQTLNGILIKLPAPKLNEICTIVGMGADPVENFRGCDIYVSLKEYGGAFTVLSFRPVEENRTERGMKILRKILKTTKQTEDA